MPMTLLTLSKAPECELSPAKWVRSNTMSFCPASALLNGSSSGLMSPTRVVPPEIDLETLTAKSSCDRNKPMRWRWGPFAHWLKKTSAATQELPGSPWNGRQGDLLEAGIGIEDIEELRQRRTRLNRDLAFVLERRFATPCDGQEKRTGTTGSLPSCTK
jgi:hypothetical protein